MYCCAQTSSDGAARVTKLNTATYRQATEGDNAAVSDTARPDARAVRVGNTSGTVWRRVSTADERSRAHARTWRRRRRSGKSANASMETSMSAKTETSSTRRDARTTDAEIAALTDSTDVNLETAALT